MASSVPFLDCCRAPVLETLRSVYQSNHDAEALCRCLACRTHWFYRFSEYVSYLADDDLTVWYTALSDAEAESILRAFDRPDLSFLRDRPSWMQDASGTTRVSGQPDAPWS